MKTIIPPRLRKGDAVGIISPASPVAHLTPRRLKRGIDQLKKLGFKVKLGKYVATKHGHTAGTIEQRVEDLHVMFANPEVKAVWTTIGGFNSHQLLEYIDYSIIANNSKILIGYSDITALLNGIYARTGLITYSGPSILTQVAEYGGILDYTWQYAEKAVMTSEDVAIQASKQWTDELTWWDKEDNRHRVMKENPGMRVLKAGTATGKLLGGNGGTFLLLAGTSYMPDLTGAILCIEEDELETSATVDRIFTKLRHIGAYEKIGGMLIGRFNSKTKFTDDDSLEEIIAVATRGYDFPIIADIDFGHTDPMITIPIGGYCSIHTESLKIIFSHTQV